MTQSIDHIHINAEWNWADRRTYHCAKGTGVLSLLADCVWQGDRPFMKLRSTELTSPPTPQQRTLRCLGTLAISSTRLQREPTTSGGDEERQTTPRCFVYGVYNHRLVVGSHCANASLYDIVQGVLVVQTNTGTDRCICRTHESSKLRKDSI